MFVALPEGPSRESERAREGVRGEIADLKCFFLSFFLLRRLFSIRMIALFVLGAAAYDERGRWSEKEPVGTEWRIKRRMKSILRRH